MTIVSRLPRRAWLMVIVAGFLGFCAVLRAPVGVIPPLLTRLGQDLGMGEVARGALTSVPILCFGLLTPLASTVVRRVGINTAGLLTLGMALVGALLRSAGATWAAFVGTVIIGAGLTVGNLVAPMVIGWQGSAAAWTAIPVLLAGALWLWVFPPGSQAPRQSLRERSGMTSWVTERSLARPTPSTGTAVWRRPLTWVMAVAFAAQTFSYYAISGWLPTALVDELAMSESVAGVAASVFSLLGIVGPLMVPVMFETLGWPVSRVLGAICACWLMLPICMTVAPGYWLVPCMFSGIAHGAFFAALFTLVIRRSASVDENRRTTAVIQTTGYCLAAVGPVVMGWVHEHSGGWVAPFAMVVGVLVLMTVCAQIAARAGDSGRPEPAIPAGVLRGDERAEDQGGDQ